MNVLVIGGGIIGLSIARELRLSGITKIRVIENSTAGTQASWAAAGMLAPNAEAEKAGAFYNFCAASNAIYADFVRRLAEESGVDVDYRKCGTIEVALSDDEAASLSAKIEQQRSQGFKLEAMDSGGILSLEPNVSQSVVCGVHYPDDGYIDNRKLLEALTVYLRLNGIDIEDHLVESLIVEGDRITGAIASNRTYDADVTILATGAWSSLIKIGVRPLPFNVKPIKGQMSIFAHPSLNLRKVVIAQGAYLTPRDDGRILVGATVEDVGFDRRIDDDAISGLKTAARRTMPMLERIEPVETWCGFRPFAGDGLPIIGEINGLKDLFIATAHFRNGILLAPLTARIIADKIVRDIESPFIRAFRPQRFLQNSGASYR